jgi:hypothetical protein
MGMAAVTTPVMAPATAAVVVRTSACQVFISTLVAVPVVTNPGSGCPVSEQARRRMDAPAGFLLVTGDEMNVVIPGAF